MARVNGMQVLLSAMRCWPRVDSFLQPRLSSLTAVERSRVGSICQHVMQPLHALMVSWMVGQGAEDIDPVSEDEEGRIMTAGGRECLEVIALDPGLTAQGILFQLQFCADGRPPQQPRSAASSATVDMAVVAFTRQLRLLHGCAGRWQELPL